MVQRKNLMKREIIWKRERMMEKFFSLQQKKKKNKKKTLEQSQISYDSPHILLKYFNWGFNLIFS